MKRSITTGLLLAALLFVGACSAFGNSQGAAILPTTITLHYDASSLVIQNVGDNTMSALNRLEFVRGEPNADSDDYAASRIAVGPLEPGRCYSMTRRQGSPVTVAGCPQSFTVETMPNVTNLFWRVEPVGAATFDVLWDGESIAQCQSYSILAEGIKQCTFTYPPAPQTQ